MSTVVRERALSLLGAGIPATTVAASLGVTPAAISQLLSEDEFSSQVSTLRCAALARHNERDNKYDTIEDALLDRLERAVPMMHKPIEVLKAIQIVNGAKRRGASTDASITEKQTVVQLVAPVQLLAKFQVNIQGQVVSVDDTSLVTIQSSALDSLAKNRLGQRNDSIKTITGKESNGAAGTNAASHG